MTCDHPGLDWIKQYFTSPPTRYRLYGRRFLQVKTQPTVSKYWRKCYKWQIKQQQKTTKYTNAQTILDTKN